jgi:hypothetical protein
MLDYSDTRTVAQNARLYTHFFDADTMRFFNSRIGDVAYRVFDKDGSEHVYFTTSERFNDETPRLYSVRVMHVLPGRRHWTVDTLGEFQAYKTGKAAKAAMVKAAQEHDAATGATDHKAWHAVHVAARDAYRAAERAAEASQEQSNA